MSRPARTIARGLAPEALLALAAGLAAFVFSLVYQRPGVVLSPDGWAYWEGSVSLLHGEGYRYLDGPAIRAWPPGFSAYLALWQLVFGVRAGTLALAHAAALGAAAALWSAVATRFVAFARAPLAAFAAAATFAFLLPLFLRAVLSESLFLALMGGALLAAVPKRADAVDSISAAAAGIARWLPFTAAATGMMLTRHVGVAYLPALAWLAWREGPRRGAGGRLPAMLAAATAVALWWTARVGLGMLGSNPRLRLDGEAAPRVADNLVENAGALWTALFPASGPGLAAAGLLAAALAFVVRPAESRRSGTSATSRPGLLPVVLLAAGCAAAAWALHGVRGARIVQPIAALVVLLLAQATTRAARPLARRLALGLLLAVAAIQVGRAAFWFRHALDLEGAALPWSVEIVRPCPAGESCRLAPGEIEPPSFGWIERRPASASTR